MSDLSIRFAEPGDVRAILGFIVENAEHIGLQDEVIATEEVLLQSLFGEKPQAEVLIGEVDGAAVGFALFFYAFSTYFGKSGIYLEDLYVSPESRGKGYGKILLSHLAKITIERDCPRLEWSAARDNTNTIEFYKALGAYMKDRWVSFRLVDKSLENLANSIA